ncbi:MAG: tRNA (adenosine(37)-N6)-dimethylallyltransferase MiaA [Rickettsiales bacterium]|nr:tRNA (adenosine(37)-N6)-dimethylallyltransferase MiaA [Rickettsiales bacterium]MCA0254295.1 tRNA (adenosine(37)-N6)-dimethylallyltransferase MiaA [Pseudomonadota bacterium]
MNRAIIICGPTASGKSQFAHVLASKYNGEIVNADSMQIYKQLKIITSSPPEEQKLELKHHLYNFLDIDKHFSAVDYANMAQVEIENINKKGKIPFVVGGSGMYIDMLLNGYSTMPSIDVDVRENVRALYQKLGALQFFQLLKEVDPEVAKILNINDKQRVQRAYEVVSQTGKSILYFQSQGRCMVLENYQFTILCIIPKRELLYEMCNKRFKEFVNNGAIDEAKYILDNYPNLDVSGTKALGLQELMSYLKGQITIENAIEIASAKTRQYAKRQCTWFSHQLKEKREISYDNLSQYYKIIDSFIIT